MAPRVKRNVYRDGKVFVLTEKCPTCVFWPGNRMHLQAGRVKDMVDQCLRNGGAIPCHKTLDSGKMAMCRGFWDAYRNEIIGLRLAQVLGMIEETTLSGDDSRSSDELS